MADGTLSIIVVPEMTSDPLLPTEFSANVETDEGDDRNHTVETVNDNTPINANGSTHRRLVVAIYLDSIFD